MHIPGITGSTISLIQAAGGGVVQLPCAAIQQTVINIDSFLHCNLLIGAWKELLQHRKMVYKANELLHTKVVEFPVPGNLFPPHELLIKEILP